MIGRPKSFTILASGARTTTQNDVDRHNDEGHRGIAVVLDVTAGATLALTLRVQMKDATSGKFLNIASSAAVAGVSTTRLHVYPGVTAVANQVISEALPELYRIVVEHGNGNSATYSLSACLIP